MLRLGMAIAAAVMFSVLAQAHHHPLPSTEDVIRDVSLHIRVARS
jgi:hypothetical protein